MSNNEGSRKKIRKSRRRFFPAPYRLDTNEPQEAFPSSYNRKLSSSKRKKNGRRLLFTSELRRQLQPLNEDGTPNVEYQRQQESIRFGNQLYDICGRYENSHLLGPQDEVDLFAKNGPRIVRDRGVIRAMKQDYEFGYYIKKELGDTDEDEDEDRKKNSTDHSSNLTNGSGQEQDPYDPVDSDEDEIGGWDDTGFLKSQYPEFADQGDHSGSDDADANARDDPDLCEFLEAEKRRRELCGEESSDDGDGDGDDVVDFSKSSWDNTTLSSWRPNRSRSTSKSPSTYPFRDTSPHTNSCTYTTIISDSGSADELDMLPVGPPKSSEHDSKVSQWHKGYDSYLAMIAEKRSRVESLVLGHEALHSPTEKADIDSTSNERNSQCVGTVLPYGDVAGLAELLGIV